MDTVNAQISNAVVNRINSSETIQQNIAIKMMKETMQREQQIAETLIESGLKVPEKSMNATFEYVA